MYVDISSSNGQGYALHVVDKWRFKIFHSSLVPMDTIEERNYFICSPKNLAVDSNNGNFFYGSKVKVGENVVHR